MSWLLHAGRGGNRMNSTAPHTSHIESFCPGLAAFLCSLWCDMNDSSNAELPYALHNWIAGAGAALDYTDDDPYPTEQSETVQELEFLESILSERMRIDCRRSAA